MASFKLSLMLAVALLASLVYPTVTISRWLQFSSSYHDLKVTLRRYGHCVGDLTPLRDGQYNETEFLVHQMRTFLDYANYDNEQLSNVTHLMESICRSDAAAEYPISVNIDVAKYSNNSTGKENRCLAIDEAMDAMYFVFKRAALNKSEPLDFSAIQFYANKTASYGLIDLINTSWIKSDTLLEHVCRITDSVKDYIQARINNVTARLDKSQSVNTGVFYTLLDIIDRILDPIFGLEKRLYWEGSNRAEQIYNGVGNQLSYLRNGISSGLKGTRNLVSGLFRSSNSTSSVSSTKSMVNSTSLNSTSANSTAKVVSLPTVEAKPANVR